MHENYSKTSIKDASSKFLDFSSEMPGEKLQKCSLDKSSLIICFSVCNLVHRIFVPKSNSIHFYTEYSEGRVFNCKKGLGKKRRKNPKVFFLMSVHGNVGRNKTKLLCVKLKTCV